MGWGGWVGVGLALAVLTVAAVLVAAVVGVLLVTHLDYNYIMRLSLYYVGVGYFNVFPACPGAYGCSGPAASPNAPIIFLRPYRIETVTVGNRTVVRFIGPYGGPWYDPGAAFVGVIRVTVGLSLSNEPVPPIGKILVAYQWDIFPTRSITIPRVIPVNVSITVDGVGRVVAVGNVTLSGVGCFVPTLVQYLGGYRFRYFNQSQYSFCIPSSAEFSGIGVTPELATWAIQNALKPVLNRAYGAVLEVLETLPPVKRYIGNGKLVLVQESIAVSWNGTRAVPEYIFYVFGFNVIAPNGTRTGIIGVSLNLIPISSAYSPGYIYLHINLVPKTYVQALNSLRLSVVGASYTFVNWAGYVFSYDSGQSSYGNDTFAGVGASIFVPSVSVNPACPSGEDQGLLAWVGLSPSLSIEWGEPYIQAGWGWMYPPSSLGYYFLVWASAVESYQVQPVQSPFSTQPSSAVEVAIAYQGPSTSGQQWGITYALYYPNGTVYNVTTVVTVSYNLCWNWEAAQYIVETPKIGYYYACMPSVNPNNIILAGNEVWDAVTPANAVGTPSWTCINSLLGNASMGLGTLYYYITLSNDQPTAASAEAST